MTYPEVNGGGKRYTYGFDAMGRTNAMLDNGSTTASLTFGVAGAFDTPAWPTSIL